VHYTLHNAHATHGPRTRHAHATHTPLIRLVLVQTEPSCIVATHHAHATGVESYTYVEFVEHYGEVRAKAEWLRAGRKVAAARRGPKVRKLVAAGAGGPASGGCAPAGGVRVARSPAPAPAPTCAASVCPPASASASASTGGDGGGGGGGGVGYESD
jgi:hypothetical protein